MLKVFGYIILFFLKEIKDSFIKIKDYIIHFIITQYNSKKNKAFNAYLKENYNYWKNKNSINKTNSKILFTDFVSVAGNTIITSIINKYVTKIENLESIGLVRNYDTRGEKIFRSFGINNVHFLKYGGLFRKLIFFLEALKYYKNIKMLMNF